ncbi:MAG TPA: hypothetical protein VHG93_29190 [Longimicrobium sp.]|nr:hypothetical protein [Longimicrobium sp.]
MLPDIEVDDVTARQWGQDGTNDPRHEIIRAVEDCLRSGWARVHLSGVGQREEALADAFRGVGVLRASRRSTTSVIDALIPVSQESALPRSLSVRFGTGELPFHTDGAHLRVPPRLLVLYCAMDEERRPTRLLHWDAVERGLSDPQQLRREVFRYRSGRDSFLDTIAASHREYVRLDPGCMVPATRRADTLLGEIRERMTVLESEDEMWEAGAALVIDNWRVLHGRGQAERAGARVLFRLQLDLYPSAQ